MPQIFAKILFFAIILIYFVSCSSIKHVQDDENLLIENTVFVNEKKNSKNEISQYIVQRPNQKTLSLPLSLYFYNLGKPDFEKTFEEWIQNHPKKYNSYVNKFSEKQTKVIYNTNRGFNNWFMNKGQAPIIYDPKKTKRSTNSLKDYFVSQGYFDTEVVFDTVKPEEKKLKVDYRITTNNQYYVDSVSTDIESVVIDSLYEVAKEESFIKKENAFIFNDFESEENRLVSIFRNAGIFHFKKNSMGFWTDSIKQDFYKDVLIKIPNRVVTVNDSIFRVPYKIQKVNEINIYTNFSIKNKNKKITDSVKYNGYNFYSYGKLKYKPKYLVNALFITPNGPYKDSERNLTRSHLRKLNSFSSSIEMNYTENEDESLTADIYLSSLKKYSITFDFDATTSNIKPFGILGKFSFLGRNIFGGSETLELAFQGSLLNVANDASNSSNFFNAWEGITSASLTFPRILFPINTSSIIPKYMAPRTNIDASVSFQKNIGLDRQATTAGMAYSWKSSSKVGHRVDIFNLQYIKNQNINNYFKIYDSEYQKLNDATINITGNELPENTVDNFNEINDVMQEILDDADNQENFPDDYDSVSDVNERQEILIEDVMVPVVAYSFVHNTRKNIDDNSFSYFTARIVSAGAIANSLVKNKNEIGQKTLFDLPIAQFFKVEFEYKKYWDLQMNNVLVFRTFIGAAIPYGNSTNIPFSRSYSAGGSNDLRAWRTYDLGPGGEINNLEFKVGTFKLITNLEYRFQVSNKIYSALFIDAGNIWDITDSDLVSDEGKLIDFNSLKNTAIGSGMGLRYDFGFLVFRLDVGFKTYEPYLLSQNKWFVNYNFGNAVYNIGINYPF